MNLFFEIVFGFYFLGMMLLFAGLRRSIAVKFSPVPDPVVPGKLTVIVPYRNEEACIVNVVQDIIGQNYRPDAMEVIFVDDHSTDRSSEIVRRFIQGRTQYRCVSLADGKEGKKQAITFGIELASGGIIVTTDADCRLPVHWLQGIVRSFQDDRIKLVFGGVRMKEDQRLFSRIQALEFSSLIGSGAALAGLGIPVLCNGANLAFLKSAFLEVNGYEGNIQIPSGDDEFLLHKIHQRFPRSIRFSPEEKTVVETKPQESLNAFLNQRLRWAGKWKFSKSKTSRLLAVCVLLFQVSFVALWLMPLFGKTPWPFAATLLSGKVILEFAFLFAVNDFLTMRLRPFPFLALQFLYPFYVIAVGIASLFVGMEWKGRSWKRV